jgi:hypothetical protein
MLTVQLAYELRDTTIKVNAAETIRRALLPDDGPTGTYSDSRGIVPW